MSISVSGAMTTPSKVVFIGAGNLAWNIAPAIDSLKDFEVVQVVARTLESARSVSCRLANAQPLCSTDLIDSTADVYIIAVGDSDIPLISARLAGVNTSAIWAHTSGSISLDTLIPLGKNIGVFYPMQTFSKGREISIDSVPFFIEGSNDSVTRQLTAIARQLSDSVTLLSGDDRTLLHAAAVFACNFTNHLLAISSELLSHRGISFDVMKPLVEETVIKAFATGPDNGQTGPARRGDISTINRHADIIGQQYARLYRLLSDSIINRFKENV